MTFLRNAMIFAKKTPVKVWLVAIIVPGGLIGVTLCIVGKSAHRLLKRRNEKTNTS